VALKGLSSKGADADAGDGEIMAEINITPLVDVFLVLLIIFMVTASALTQTGVDVNLPASNAQSSETEGGGVIVTLLSDGRVRVNGKVIQGDTLKGLEQKVKVALAQDPKANGLVILEGDRQAMLGQAIEVMDAARRGGAKKFAIATQTEKK
jgi:biopolymer transport protein ExbD